MFSDDEINRYARHLVLHDVGGAGQQRLKAADVTIIGLGGLGGVAALYLAAAGVGHLTLIDGDTVTLSNLQRQIPYATSDIGQSKAAVLAARIAELNPHVTAAGVTTHAEDDLTLRPGTVVLDGTDDFNARFLINRAAIAAGAVLVSGALGPWTAQVGVFAGHMPDQPCYRCFVPAPPPGVDSCATLGIIGALAGVAGTMMALEAIKLITGAGDPLLGRIWLWDGKTATGRTIAVPKDKTCPDCGAH
jgi:molybdopterin/thiamine biosynthesis adenylyltransferase